MAKPAPALWEATAADGSHAFIFGTVHALPDGYEWTTPALEQAFAGSTELLVEVDLAAQGDTIAGIFDRLAHSANLPPLTARLAGKDRAALEQALAAKGLDEADFRDTESWAAAIALSQAYEESSGNGVDLALLKASKGKRIVELEGAEPQLRMFDSLREKDQRELLAAVAREALEGDGKSDARLQSWLRGDVNALVKETHEGMLADPELRQALLVARNNAWAERIAREAAGGKTVFVAVGAAHTVGPDGLAALLEAKGFAVKRVQ
ncbi:MAG: TraB/GumN family protein [Candidatus Andeanibacterium colombiense]|uniref:TraB/GumN family protein n=1 Tax=Candidatus Andeanibacterium colombiense TaxID=3121345 RepID=A0AAJ5X5Z2_9SPHN|nr:MAG: TraB/GumN family protein [Sphingomonadaceae bacterium]